MKKKNFNCKFPLPRIKKIIQQNEDIGKVSHSIPFLVSKSLEMFLSELIKKSAQLAKDKESSKLTPFHLKKCVETEEKYAFLSKLVEDVPDNEEGSKGAKAKPAPSGKGKGRKGKKGEIHDDEDEDDDDDIELLEKPEKKMKKN